MRTSLPLLVLALGGVFPVGVSLGAQAVRTPSQALPAPLFDDLGSHSHPVGTASELAQRYFDQGLVLLYGFNHAEAVRSFQAAAEVDPQCAMAYWGVAYALGPNINAPMDSTAASRAWEALQQALGRIDHANRRDRAYIDALAQRYRAEAGEDRKGLDQAYADAMREVARAYPDDTDAGTLFAEALLDTMPWDYWTKDLQPKPATREALTALREVLRRDPDHPGANHFFIHAVEAGPEPEVGLPSADRLAHLVPGAGHLVHMPCHIYARVGQYHEATLANERAVRADQSYLSQCRAQGFYPGLYYPHNIHFLWFTLGLEGRSEASIGAAVRVAAYAADNVCGPATVAEAPRFRHLPLLAQLRFGHWDDVLRAALPDGASELVMDRALFHYARGLAWLARGRVEQAEAEKAEFDRLAAGPELAKLESAYFPALKLADVAAGVLAGKLAGARGDPEGMIRELEAAVEAQDAIPYMEPPYWYYPVRQSLGAALIKTGRPAYAEAVFREDLKRLPRNGWGLFGLAESLRRQGKAAEAASVDQEFEKAWSRADVQLELGWF